MSSITRRFGVLHITFLSVVGLMGWVAVLAVTLWPPNVLRPWAVSGVLAAILVQCAVARFLVFRVFRRVRIAIDSAFYVATVFVLGCVPGAWLLLIVLTTDAVVQLIRGRAVALPGSPWYYKVAQTIYSGGLPAFVMLAAGSVFHVDSIYPRDDLTLAWLVPSFAITFLLSHYLIAGGEHWLGGTPPKELFENFFVRVVAAELTLMPIALAMVYGYLHQGAPQFLLLGGSGLLFNWIFRRARVATDKMHERVQELSTLNRVGAIISGSLEREVLVRNIATEALRLLGRGSQFLIGTLDEQRERADFELYLPDGGCARRFSAPAMAGLPGWVVSHQHPLKLNRVERDYSRYAAAGAEEPNCQSWLGVPLASYDEVMGLLAVQTAQRDAYNADDLRVMMTLAGQAAVALENARLYELATVDGLTRLLVRRHFDQRLSEEWQRSLRYESPLALGMLDLDGFKDLNDTHGHQTGDQVLRAAASVVRRNMRSFDLAGRYGGEEFAFVLPRTRVAEALRVADRIRSDVAGMNLSVAGRPITVTASIGVAGYPDSGVADVAALIARADEALYAAKRKGKNRVVSFVPEVSSRAPVPV